MLGKTLISYAETMAEYERGHLLCHRTAMHEIKVHIINRQLR